MWPGRRERWTGGRGCGQRASRRLTVSTRARTRALYGKKRLSSLCASADLAALPQRNTRAIIHAYVSSSGPEHSKWPRSYRKYERGVPGLSKAPITAYGIRSRDPQHHRPRGLQWLAGHQRTPSVVRLCLFHECNRKIRHYTVAFLRNIVNSQHVLELNVHVPSKFLH